MAEVDTGAGGTHCLETDRSLCLTCSEIPAPPSTSIPSALAPAPLKISNGHNHTTRSRVRGEGRADTNQRGQRRWAGPEPWTARYMAKRRR